MSPATANTYPENWAERATALRNGTAQPGDYWESLKAALRSCKHGRRIIDGCTLCDYERSPRWVTEYENGVPVRMVWYDPPPPQEEGTPPQKA